MFAPPPIPSAALHFDASSQSPRAPRVPRGFTTLHSALAIHHAPAYTGLSRPRTSDLLRLQHQIMDNAMPTVKEAMVDIISRQPEDSSYDEILRELAYARMIQRGLADSEAGQTVSDADVRSRIESWQK